MEKLKSSIPEKLRTLILSTTFVDLTSSTAALSDHFSTSFQFSEVLEQLTHPSLTTCAKDAESAANWKRDGNAAFGTQDYDRALSCYTKALRYTPVDPIDEGSRAAQAVLFVNRAATLHKLGYLEPGLRDCGRAIDAHPTYSKAWYRRSLVKCDMNDYVGAGVDMEKALASESTSGGRLQIQRELAQMEFKRISIQRPDNRPTNPSSPSFGVECAGAEWKTSRHQKNVAMHGLQNHWTKEKGSSLQTKEYLPSGSLVFQEDPYAAVVLKSARDTHCHFCFEILPADPMPCSGCSIPLYCSDLCKNNATGSLGCSASKDALGNGNCSLKSLPPGDSSANYSSIQFSSGNRKRQPQVNFESPCERWGEHIPECGGASWSAVLPSEAVLGARMLFRTVCTDNGLPTRNLNLVRGGGEFDVDTLCHHYDHLNANDKLELHVLGVSIAYCVSRFTSPLAKTGSRAEVASKVIGLIAQARVNSMAIFGMISSETDRDTGNYGKNADGINSILRSTPVCSVEQVRVAQGIFLVGSRLNHSCVPNIHASFVSGCLFIRAITNITKGSTLELCYGPQVGEMNQMERQQVLLEKYFFTCDCAGCSKLTLPDLLLRAFQCTNPGCMGIVLGPESLESKFTRKGDSNLGTLLRIAEEQKLEVTSEEKESEQRRQTSRGASNVSHLDNEFCKASFVCQQIFGRCLYCGTVLDTERVHEVAMKASAHLEWIEAKLNKKDSNGRDVQKKLKGALKALTTLRAILHPYNMQLAKGEDIVGQLLCELNEPLKALKHCQKSIEILEHLFNQHHIVLGNEHLKLTSVALMASDVECARQSLVIVDRIFTVHYGSDYGSRIPYVVHFQKLVESM